MPSDVRCSTGESPVSAPSAGGLPLLIVAGRERQLVGRPAQRRDHRTNAEPAAQLATVDSNRKGGVGDDT